MGESGGKGGEIVENKMARRHINKKGKTKKTERRLENSRIRENEERRSRCKDQGETVQVSVLLREFE